MLIKSLPLLLVAAATTAFACEMDCRKGVAGDLAKVYTPVLEKSVDNLESSLTSSIQKVAIPAVITSDATEEDVNAIIEDSIKSTLKTFVSFATDEKRLANGIYRVLFTEELPYKGDCNHPARLTRKMPPDGESWTLDECEKMDYRCGNPPSICHFLGDVKQRSVGRIRRQLTEYASYDNGVLVTDLVKNTKSALYSTLDSSLRSDQEVQTYVDKIVSNTIRTLDSWVNKDVREICDTPDQEDLCNNFDDEIKLAILKWP